MRNAVRFLCSLLIACAALRPSAQEPAHDDVIRDLTGLWNPDQAQGARPLDLEFVVNYYDPFWRVLWTQNKDSGQYLTVGTNHAAFKSGDRLRVKGVTVAGKTDIDWA